MSRQKKFRLDIQGMRAIAVLSVIFYHLPGKILTGGFLGVDVFFVISGYLITSQIVDKINQNKFTVIGFYKNRFWRLFPALLFVTLLSLIYAGTIMSLSDLKESASSALAAIFSVSNLYFYFEDNYFDAAARVKPFLHTWSLAVEEQFYLFWPLVLLGLYKITHLKRSIFLTVCVILSFIICLFAITHNPKFAFYMLPSRLFELGIGALVVFLPATLIQSSFIKSILYGAGLIGVLFPLFFFYDTMALPGFLTLIPCMGMAFMIYAGPSSPLAQFLKLRPLTLIGDWSYTLYLVHWPVIVFYIYQNGGAIDDTIGQQFSLSLSFYLLFITVLITIFCHYLIERPLRYRDLTVKFAGLWALTGVGFSVLIGTILFITAPTERTHLVKNDKSDFLNPLLDDFNAYANEFRQICGERHPQKKPCYYDIYKKGLTLDENYGFVIYGDSYAPLMTPVAQSIGEKTGLKGVIFAKAACAPVIGDAKFMGGYHNDPAYAPKCIKHTDDFFKYIESRKNLTIIVTQQWSAYQHFQDRDHNQKKISENYGLLFIENKKFQNIFDNFMSRLQATNHKIIINSAIPTFRYDTLTCLQQNFENPDYCPFKREPSSDDMITSINFKKYMADHYPNFYLLDHFREFCENLNQCRVIENGNLLYADKSHLSRAGVQKIVPSFLPFFNKNTDIKKYKAKTFKQQKPKAQKEEINAKSPHTQIRIQNLTTLNSAIDQYQKKYKTYPSSKGQWISTIDPDKGLLHSALIPEFIDKVSQDPARESGPFAPKYSYISDGKDYKLIVQKSWDCAYLPPELMLKPDPARSYLSRRYCSAWGYWTKNYAMK